MPTLDSQRLATSMRGRSAAKTMRENGRRCARTAQIDGRQETGPLAQVVPVVPSGVVRVGDVMESVGGGIVIRLKPSGNPVDGVIDFVGERRAVLGAESKLDFHLHDGLDFRQVDLYTLTIGLEMHTADWNFVMLL